MFRRLPIARKLLTIVAIFVLIVVCVFFLGVFRSQVLTGVRAYVGGESLWSKAEKRAVISLTRFAEGHDERDYQEYLSEIAVPIGDKQARLELQKSSPDFEVVRRGFVQGRISAEDVDSMAMLFRRFGNIGYMARAISVWTTAIATSTNCARSRTVFTSRSRLLPSTRRKFRRLPSKSRPSMPA
jgi:hypothetical protein